MAISGTFQIGDNITATFTDNAPPSYGYTLNISGTGPMYFDASDIIPISADLTWDEYIEGIDQDILTIPDDVTSIMNNFLHVRDFSAWPERIGTLIIGRSVEFIGDYAFYMDVNGYDSDPDYFPDYGYIGYVLIKGNSIRKLGNCCFMGQSKITELDFHGSVEKIGWNSCFKYCSGLERLYLADDWEFETGYIEERQSQIQPTFHFGDHAFFKCKSLWRISDNNTICCIDDNNPLAIVNNVGFGGNYDHCNNLYSITIRNPIDDFNYDVPLHFMPNLHVKLWAGLNVDSEGYFITELECPFQSIWDLVDEFKNLNNRIIIHKIDHDFGVYVYHMGRIIKHGNHNDGQLPVAHEGEYKHLGAVKGHENPSYSPVHFVHNGEWYQLKY